MKILIKNILLEIHENNTKVIKNKTTVINWCDEMGLCRICS